MVDKTSKISDKNTSGQILRRQHDLLSTWRETALDWILRGGFVFTLPLLILGFVNIAQGYRSGRSLTQSISLASLYCVVYFYTALITFFPRFGFKLRVGSLILILSSVGIANLANWGLSSDGLLFIFAAIAFSAIFYNFRRTLAVQVIELTAIAIIAGLLISGVLVVAPEPQITSANLASWIEHGMVIALLSTALVLATTYLVASLEDSLASSRKQAEHLASLNEIALDISIHKNMSELLQTIVTHAATLLQTDGSLLYLIDGDEDTLLKESVFGKGQKHLSRQLRRGEGVAGRVLVSGKPLIIKDYEHWEGKSAVAHPETWGSIIQVPILLLEKVIGVLGCYTIYGQERDFDQEDIATLQGLARQAAVAIENINSIDAAQQAEARLEAIVQAAPSAIISADREQHIIMFNKAAENMFGYSADEILNQDVNLLLPMRFHHSHPKYVDEFTNKTSNENAILIPRELIGLRANGEEFPVEVSVSKVENNGKMILTVIMQDITLRKQTENALRNSERRAKILLNLSKSLEISQTYEEVLQASLEIIEVVVGYRNVWFYLYSDNRETARLVGAAGWNVEKFKEGGSVLTIQGNELLEEISMGNAPVVVEDARTDPRTNKDSVAYFENRSIINIPAFIMDQHLGILGAGSFGDEDTYVPTAAELDFLSAMASHIVISVDKITQTQERARAESEIIRNNQNQKIINTLLQLGLKNISLYQKLEHALDVTLSTPWLSVLPRGAIFLADENNNDLKMVAQRNLSKDLQITCAIVKPGICLCGRAGEKKETLFSTSRELEHEIHTDGEELHSHYTIPITLADKLQGLLVLYLPVEHLLDEKEVEFLTAVANTLAGLIDRASAQEKIKQINADLILAYDSTLEGWAKALDLRDKETGDHTLRVAELSVTLARSMNIPDDELVHIWRGALLHDIGKMSIPDDTLKKESSLNPAEWAVMQQHPQNAYDMLSSITYLEQALDIPYCHHEKWDGSGYPRGLKGEQIPLAARIFSLVDVWDALSSDRPYRQAWSLPKIIDYICERSGTQFDPDVVDAFLKLVGDE